MNDLEKMDVKQLYVLKNDIEQELVKRKRAKYDKLLKNFAEALLDLYENFPYEYCFADETVTWEDLHERYDWVF